MPTSPPAAPPGPVARRRAGGGWAYRLTGGAGLALVAAALAPDAAAQSALDLVRDDYRDAVETARPTLLGIARATFGILAVLEIALAALWWTLRERGPADVLSALVVKLGWLGFVYGLLASFDFWFVPVIDGFVAAGQRTAVGPPMSPGDILAVGVEISTALREGFFDEVDGLDFFTNLGLLDTAFTVLVTSLLIEIAYVLIAAVVVLTFVEAYVALTTGSLVLGFAAFRGTASLADRFVAYAFAVGIRLFLLFLLVGIGQNLAEGWALAIEADPLNKAVLAEVLGGTLTFVLIILVIPFRAASQLTAGFDPGLARGLLAVG